MIRRLSSFLRRAEHAVVMTATTPAPRWEEPSNVRLIPAADVPPVVAELETARCEADHVRILGHAAPYRTGPQTDGAP